MHMLCDRGSLCYIIALISGSKKVLYKSYVHWLCDRGRNGGKGGLEPRVKEIAGEKNWSRKQKRETNVSRHGTVKGKDERSEMARCYPS